MGLIVIQGDTDVLVLRFRRRKFCCTPSSNSSHGEYDLPSFYAAPLRGAKPKSTEYDNEVKRMRIHAERVGEYTLNTCG